MRIVCNISVGVNGMLMSECLLFERNMIKNSKRQSNIVLCMCNLYEEKRNTQQMQQKQHSRVNPEETERGAGGNTTQATNNPPL